MAHLRRIAHWLTPYSILLTFALLPFWGRLPDAPATYSIAYTLGFAVSIAMLLTIALWVCSGCAGWRTWRGNRWRLLWIASLLALVVWAWLSINWSFIREREPTVAASAALRWTLVAGFALVCLSRPPRLRWILLILVASLLIHGTLGGVQVALQSDIGLRGEVTLNPAESGVSVIQSGEVRWLRPYGLLPHPNILAGILAVGLLAIAPFLLRDKYRWRWSLVWLAGLWLLLLTFSRGAWLGFGGGLLTGLILLRDTPRLWQKLLPVIIASVLVAGAFTLNYQPLLIARTGITQENTEQRSIVDRLVYQRIAAQSILQRPVQGWGAGNFPWVASYYLFYYTDYDLRGNNVHNIYLTVAAELGVVGLALLLTLLVSGLAGAMQTLAPDRAALIAGVVALALIGLVDHYPVTLPHTSALWLGLQAIALSEPTPD